ncbi:MAG: carboxypeptidase regulatory-like domain-containing protein [Bacteroidia bacterium]|nr:carboxypeptidase regulatory-like domain-containing protein [Bacteroidia bacterium]
MHIPGITQPKEEKYDLVIFHQVPNIYRTGDDLLSKYKDVAQWFILGSQSDLNAFNRINNSLRIANQIRRSDRVTPVYNQSFSKFTFEGSKVSLMEKLPPVSVPFAEYSLSNSSEVLLTQRVGNIDTGKPLLIVNQNGNTKTAILTGEGIWQWRLEEFALEDSHESFDELVSKLVQFLSTKEDKRRLRVYPIRNEFYDFEKVIFESEVYNEIYERIYGQKINLSITNAQGKTTTYSFTSDEGNTRFEISGLPKGIYSYVASAQLQDRVERSSGEFTVRDLQLEALNNTANHNLLRQLSGKSGGTFYTPAQLRALEDELLKKRKPNIIHSTEDLSEMINLKWIFFLLLGLAALEWSVRKYQGSY